MSQFHFAWADPPSTGGGVPPFGPAYEVEDEEIVHFEVSQSEGDAATLTIDIRNPRIGLLNPGRKIWAWFSVALTTGGAQPLFYGRLVGIPTNLFAEIVTLQFTAKSPDLVSQKYDLAFAELMVLPGYDPVWIDPDKRPAQTTGGDFIGDIDVVLEGYSKLWHIDRLTLGLSVSDLIEPEDGTEVFAEDEVPYDSVSLDIGSPPLTSVKVIGHISWSQSANGIIDFGERWFDTWTGGSIKNSWPSKGSGLAGGWSVYDSFAIDVYNVEGQTTVTKQFNFENREKTHNVGDPMSISESYTLFPVGGSMFISDLKRQAGVVPSSAVISYDSAGVPFDPYGAIDTEGGDEKAIPLHMSYNQTLIAGWKIHTMLKLQYDAGDKRMETARFNMVPDLQPIVTQPDPTEVEEQIELTGTDVGLEIDGTAPLGDTSRNQYFTTDRGKQSFEYLLNVARAHILYRARPVTITFDVPFERAIDLTLRKSATLNDSRLPGGVATGKITSYMITGDGDSGELKGTCTIACPIGRDGTIETVPPVPSGSGSGLFIDAGFVDDGSASTTYFVESGGTIVLNANTAGTGDLGYTIPDVVPTGLIYPLTKAQVTVAERVDTFITEPVQVGSDTDAHGNTTKTFATSEGQAYYLELKPVDGTEFNTDIQFEVTALKVKRGIDLEADEISA